MSIISKPNTFSPNTSISSSQVNANFDTIYNDYNGGIAAANLATGAVTTAKIADLNVTTAKIGDDQVTAAKVADGAIDAAAKISDGVVTSEKLDATIACRAYRNAALNITNAGVKIAFDTENFDLGSNFNTATGTFTAPVTGYYHVTASLGVQNLDAGGQVFVQVYLNGVAYNIGKSFSVASTDDPVANVTDLIPVTAGQTLEAYGTTSTTESATVNSSTTYIAISFEGV